MFFSVPEVEAQYFGRNKVQYEDFNFQILQTSHFDIYHYPQEERAIKDLGRLSERWYQRHTELLGHRFKTRNPLIIYANHADFQQNDVVPSVGVGTGGVTEGLRNRVIMPFAEANQSTNHVLGHELVHAFQYDIARTTDKIGGIRATSQLPLWFIEGMAEYASIGPESTHTGMWLRDAVHQDTLPTIRQLGNSQRYFPYRFGHSVWAYITGEWGDKVVSPLYVNSAQKGLRQGIESTLNISMDSLSTLWQHSVREKYAETVRQHDDPSEVGTKILGKSKDTGTINAGPSLSPNGEYVAFISEKSLFSVELFVADAETGEIIRSLTSTVTNPHLNALRFIESAGTWSPDGEQFAAVVFAEGDNQIIIIDVETGNTVQTLKFGAVDAITNPSWSPDGEKIAFSGADGGYTDLYVYNMEEESLQNLTRDRYSDLQPTWSPDGSQLAFVTDRGPGTDFDKLTFGKTRIGMYDLETGDIDLLPEFPDAKHINPQFGPDGTSLYYISDYRGISNLYRYDFEAAQRYQLTSVNTGISGISTLSPALTVAGTSGDVMVSVFEASNYSVYRIPEEETIGTQVLTVEDQLADANDLPPVGLTGNEITSSYFREPYINVPSADSFRTRDYTPKLKITGIGGGIGGGVGVSSQLGAGAAGGVTMQFSDMLNQHQLIASVRAQGRIKDIGGQVSYLNQDNRFIYGASVSHQPYRTSAAGVTSDTLETGQEVAVVQRLNRRIFQDRISLLGMYPFSKTQRLEFSAGWTHIWYDLELQETLYNPLGQPIDRTRESLSSPSPLNLYNMSAAYVEDNSISAFTGPIRGHRLRFEVEPTTGDFSYLNALADYRRYVYMRPFTLAFRGLHSGRYFQGGNAEEQLSPNFIGYETLMRGYNTSSFTPSECGRTREEGCAVLNRLSGSRMAVANVEFRIPVLGAEQLALFRSRTVPTTLSTFFDAGYAWTANEPFRFSDLKWTSGSTNERAPVFSTGLSARVNILGYLIAEIYYAIPFQRPNKSGYVGFTISPGW
ncbi:hypothetical protein ACG2F4_17635 [Halalkalibaculum sp. DA3122]|uniref:hypothetical protein n=1 Tax=Halalkalibaculum sp. DA3122 TaxID=3373607 RepID=UPI003754DB8D